MDIHYSYLHGPRRHVTIARSVDLERGFVYCGISICHPCDVFRKTLGREIAAGRMKKAEVANSISLAKTCPELAWILKLTTETKPLDRVMTFLAQTSIRTTVPTCVQRLAQEWILKRCIGMGSRFNPLTDEI